jgi:hypothetical protein
MIFSKSKLWPPRKIKCTPLSFSHDRSQHYLCRNPSKTLARPICCLLTIRFFVICYCVMGSPPSLKARAQYFYSLLLTRTWAVTTLCLFLAFFCYEMLRQHSNRNFQGIHSANTAYFQDSVNPRSMVSFLLNLLRRQQ